jgi:hypothetical protein
VLGPDDPITLGTAAALTLARAVLGEMGPAHALGQDTPAAPPPDTRPRPSHHDVCDAGCRWSPGLRVGLTPPAVGGEPFEEAVEGRAAGATRSSPNPSRARSATT